MNEFQMAVFKLESKRDSLRESAKKRPSLHTAANVVQECIDVMKS